MKKFASLFVIGLILLQMPAFSAMDYDTRFGTNTRTQPGYFKNLAHDWGRGLTNIVTCPLEIPYTVMKYHREDSGRPGVKHIAGLADGLVRTVNRGAAGVWDLVVGFVPGDQGGAIVKPATLFEKEQS